MTTEAISQRPKARKKQVCHAERIVVILPLALLIGAYISQYVFGLYPCEMCWWQRYAHFAALWCGVVALGEPRDIKRPMIIAGAIFLTISGLIGGYHAGIEYGWWQGITSCTSAIKADSGDFLEAIMKAPIIRCDHAPWSLAGISLAGFNFIFSMVGAGTVFYLRYKNGGSWKNCVKKPS